MRKVILIFPDSSSIAGFLITQRIAKAEVSSHQQTLAAPLTEDQIMIACTQYGAELKQMANSTLR